MNEEDYRVVEAMERYGGSFVQALALLCFRADHVNLNKIKATWPEYWLQYSEMADFDYKKSKDGNRDGDYKGNYWGLQGW